MDKKDQITYCLAGMISGVVSGGVVGIVFGWWQLGLATIGVLAFFGLILGNIATQLHTLNIQLFRLRSKQ